MSTHKHIDRICVAGALLSLLLVLAALHLPGKASSWPRSTLGYQSRLFDPARVHTIDIVMDDWDAFLQTCRSEEYSSCTAVIDGEAYSTVGIRGKGNTSLSRVSSMDSDRYSFKLEFDQYDPNRSYYGLDKLCLNNLIQDNTMMKDYLCYYLMAKAGCPAPLCSYVFLTVNGEDWGLYLAVEAIEESFLLRNYGSDYGQLYKPEGQGMGGGMGSAGTKLQYVDENTSSYSDIFNNAKTSPTQEDKDRLIHALRRLSTNENLAQTVAVDQVIRYFAAHNFVCNDDSYTGSIVHNYYLYEHNGLLSMLPWDYNLAFGAFHSTDATSAVNAPIDTPVSGTIGEDRPMISWIFQNEEYTAQYHRQLAQLLADTDFTRSIGDAASLIAPYVERDPTKFCTYEQFLTGVDALLEFCLLRKQSVLGQLDGTIPSTTQGQRENSSTLVDASSLSLSDMGSNGMGGDRGGSRWPQTAAPEGFQGIAPFQQQDRAPSPQANNAESTDPSQPGTFPQAGQDDLFRPDRVDQGEARSPGRQGADRTRPGGDMQSDDRHMDQPVSGTSLSLLAACFLCLAAGLGFAWFFRGKR